MDRRGFTLIELMITVAIIGILATAAFFGTRASIRNANVDRAGAEFAGVIEGLRTTAMRSGRTFLFVGLDAPGNDARSCNIVRRDPCAQYFILSDPQPGWTLVGFNPATPGNGARLEEQTSMLGGVRFLLDNVPAPRPPLDTLTPNDADVLQSCTGSRRCFALRFSPNGTVRPEVAPGVSAQKRGLVIALISDLVTGADIAAGTRGGSRVFGIAMSFPYGIVRTF